MTTIDQIMRGASRFADTEIIPHLPTGKGIAAGVALTLVMEGGKQQLLALREHPAVKMMGEVGEAAFFAAMNMMYSDYCAVARMFGVDRPDFYAQLAKAFLLDKDAGEPEEKIERYWRYVAGGK